MGTYGTTSLRVTPNSHFVIPGFGRAGPKSGRLGTGNIETTKVASFREELSWRNARHCGGSEESCEDGRREMHTEANKK